MKKKKILEKITIVNFVKKFEIDKVKDQCHLTGNYRGSAYTTCKRKVTRKQKSFIPLFFHFFSIYDCHLFLDKLVDEGNDKVKFDLIPKTKKNIYHLQLVVLDLLIVIDFYQVV